MGSTVYRLKNRGDIQARCKWCDARDHEVDDASLFDKHVNKFVIWKEYKLNFKLEGHIIGILAIRPPVVSTC
jgi:hypothetical protein